MQRTRAGGSADLLVVAFGVDKPLRLDCGVDLAPFQIAYKPTRTQC